MIRFDERMLLREKVGRLGTESRWSFVLSNVAEDVSGWPVSMSPSPNVLPQTLTGRITTNFPRCFPVIDTRSRKNLLLLTVIFRAHAGLDSYPKVATIVKQRQ